MNALLKGLLGAGLGVVVVGAAALPAVADLVILREQAWAEVCAGRWDAAIATVNRMVADPGATEAYRVELLRYRAQLEEWRAQRVDWRRFEGCNGAIATQPEPQPSQPLDWERAIAGIQQGSGNRPEPQEIEPTFHLLEWNVRDDGWLVGRVWNGTGEDAQFAQIHYEIFALNGSLVDSGSFYVDREQIPAGQDSPFSFPVGAERGETVRVTRITWRPL